SGELAGATDLGRGEYRIAGEDRGRVPASAVANVGEGVVAHVGRGDAETEVERDATPDDELPAQVALRLLADHPPVAVDVGGVVEDARQHDVVGGDNPGVSVLEHVPRAEVLEVGVGARQVREVAVRALGRVGGQVEADADLLGRDFAVGDCRGRVAL